MIVSGASGLLREFNEAGVLAPADVHVARRLVRLAGEDDERVALAVALAVRAPRLGHVYVDLATIRERAAVDTEEPVDLSTLPWPDPASWLERVRASALVAVGEEGGRERPLRLVGSALYLDRYWREERRVAADLLALRDRPGEPVDEALLARLFPDDGRQRLAAATAVERRFAVVAGGPGTGKTTTVARIVALLLEQAASAEAPAARVEAGAAAAAKTPGRAVTSGGEPLVALAAPTGKAAARLTEAVHAEAARLDVSEAVRARLLGLEASTLHRLLGWRPGTHSRFRHDRGNRLPHDVVIIDETSMVSLWQMARLVEAVRHDARLILVGDPGQLASIEAGAVLGDIVGPAEGGGIVVLDRVHRYGGAIARVAEAIRRGDADAVLDALRPAPRGPGGEVEGPAAGAVPGGPAGAAGGEAEGPAGAVGRVTWLPLDAAEPGDALDPVRERAVAAARAVTEAAAAGAGAGAIEALGAFRLLCAHRRGAHGVSAWTARIESWLHDALDAFGGEEFYVGRPLLVTENDYGLRLFNGDTGVVVASGPGRVSAAFERAGEVVELSPTRLAAIETVYAMTVHKSQGSQFDTAAVLLPEPTSPILTRELLYTAVTRARRELILVGTEEAIRTAVTRPIARASGLRARLWGRGGP